MTYFLVAAAVIAAIFLYIVIIIASHNFMNWLLTRKGDDLSYDADAFLSICALIWPIGIPLFFSGLLFIKMVTTAIAVNELIIKYLKR